MFTDLSILRNRCNGHVWFCIGKTGMNSNVLKDRMLNAKFQLCSYTNFEVVVYGLCRCTKTCVAAIWILDWSALNKFKYPQM